MHFLKGLHGFHGFKKLIFLFPLKIYNLSRILTENLNTIRVLVSEIQRFKIARSRLRLPLIVFFSKL